jgi:hypothetical protein
MSTAYFIMMLKEAARLKDEVHPYSTNFNYMILGLKNEDSDLVLRVGFRNGVNDCEATLTDKGEENGDVQEVFRRVEEYITERRSKLTLNS